MNRRKRYFHFHPGKPLPRPLTHSEIMRVMTKSIPDYQGRLFQKTPCWIWAGAKDKQGYGVVKLMGIAMWVARVMYQVFRGPLLPGEQVDHRCMNESCVNPYHLEPRSLEENSGHQQDCSYAVTTEDPAPF